MRICLTKNISSIEKDYYENLKTELIEAYISKGLDLNSLDVEDNEIKICINIINGEMNALYAAILVNLLEVYNCDTPYILRFIEIEN